MLTPMLADLPEARAHQGEILRRCAELVEDGKLKPHITEALALEEAVEAHVMIEEGHVQGKVVLRI